MNILKHCKKYWAVIPAAGVGKRMASQTPKQYLPLGGKTVLEQTLSVFLRHPDISGIVLAITQGDPYWQELSSRLKSSDSNSQNSTSLNSNSFKIDNKTLIVAPGGAERCYSVLNALTELFAHAATYSAKDDDWVLVHDAARPCLQSSDIDHLIEQLSDSTEGGLLGLPIADTVKRCDSQQRVLATVDRSELWRALTPQMFPLKMLKDALQQAIDNKALVTDEASAIELLGLKPIMVEGLADNIKITHPGDLQLAEMFLSQAKHSE